MALVVEQDTEEFGAIESAQVQYIASLNDSLEAAEAPIDFTSVAKLRADKRKIDAAFLRLEEILSLAS